MIPIDLTASDDEKPELHQFIDATVFWKSPNDGIRREFFILFEFYQEEGTFCLSLFIDNEHNLPYATATVPIVDDEINKDCEIVIKNYSENEGILDALTKAKICYPIREIKPSDSYSTFHVCKLLIIPNK